MNDFNTAVHHKNCTLMEEHLVVTRTEFMSNWENIIKPFVDDCLKTDGLGLNSFQHFHDLCHLVEICVENEYGKELYENLKESVANHLTIVSANLLHESGKDTYFNLANDKWNEYNIAINIISNVFDNFDKKFLKKYLNNDMYTDLVQLFDNVLLNVHAIPLLIKLSDADNALGGAIEVDVQTCFIQRLKKLGRSVPRPIPRLQTLSFCSILKRTELLDVVKLPLPQSLKNDWRDIIADRIL
jgi:hypothetical protein